MNCGRCLAVVGAEPGAAVGAIALGYLLGCCNTAYYLVRWREGRDIRETGSGNAGASNAGRTLGRGGFVIVLILDAAKGAAAVAIARHLSAEDWVRMLAAGSVVVGHIWPAQLGFRGGKGVAPFLGTLAVGAPGLLLAVIAAFVPLYFLLRGFVASGLLALAVSLPALLILPVGRTDLVGWPVLVGMVWFAHRENLVTGWSRAKARFGTRTVRGGSMDGGVE